MVIMGITNRKICANFYDQITKISKSKLNYLIIREKDLNDNELLELSLKVKKQFLDTEIKIIINSSIKIANKINADGIQLSFKDFIEIKHKLCTGKRENSNEAVDNFNDNVEKYEIYKLVGVSIHSFEEGIQAYKWGADYVIYGHIFETDCKKDIQPRGVKEIEELSKKIDIPIIGLGGISSNNFQDVINSGASGIAIMSSLMKSQNPKELIKALLE